MDKSKQGKMAGAAIVLGLSVGIGIDLACAEETAQITAKSTSTNPQVFKFAVDAKKPGQPTAAKFDGIDGESNDARSKQPTPNNFKVTFEDIVISAKGEVAQPGAIPGAVDPNAQPRTEKWASPNTLKLDTTLEASDPNAQPRSEKVVAKPRNKAKRMHKP